METLNRDYWQKAFANLAAAFNDEKVHLCELDGAIGDGDHGASMARDSQKRPSNGRLRVNLRRSRCCLKPPAMPFCTRSEG